MVFDNLKRRLLRKCGRGFVLYGHGVVHERADDFIENLHWKFSDFVPIVDYLLNCDYEFLDMQKLVDISHSGFSHDRHWVHLTFDDGYANIADVVYPFLQSRGIPFTIFVSTNHIEFQERLYTYRLRCAIMHTQKHIAVPGTELKLANNATDEERKAFYKHLRDLFKKASKTEMLSIISYVDSLLDKEEWENYNNLYQAERVLTKAELKKLNTSPLVTIGSHSSNHMRLNNRIRKEEVEFEIKDSRNYLKRYIAIDGDLTYAYPSGTKNDFSELSKAMCKQAGYTLAFTTLHHYVTQKTDPYEISRFPLPRKLSKMKKIVFLSLGTVRK
jgi:peptidoglycan/xylan/chitin deacetylase (PgdA/CDA1 family)